MLVALGISGGIAAYKACEIVRGLDQAGVEVQVVLTEHGARFVTALTLQTLSRRHVLACGHALDDERTVQHIELARAAAVLAVAPATANALAKFSRGIADDLLSTLYIATTAPVVLAPSMNPRMLLHPATQENLARLRARGVRIVEPEHGWLAESEIGWGRMAEPGLIVNAVLEAARRSSELASRTIVITAGPTRERVDPVRVLSNRSSGKMGYALAAAAARRGARVVLISGPVHLPLPWGVERIEVESAAQMREAVLGARPGAAAVLMVAAVADYVPQASPVKLKRSGAPRTLVLDEGPDILAELGRDRQEQVLVGFAAETEDLLAHAREKLARKNLDFIVANDVGQPGVGIDAEDNAVTILDRAGQAWSLPRQSKGELAEAILDRVLSELVEGGRR